MLIYMLPGWSEPVISWCRKGMSNLAHGGPASCSFLTSLEIFSNTEDLD